MSLDDTDLFGAAVAARAGDAGTGERASLPPLAVRMRPRSVDEVRGQGDVLRPGSPLRRLIE
ncbi:MAG TPA: replication-associated recombination protein A, partial [Phycicoccus sp.]